MKHVMTISTEEVTQSLKYHGKVPFAAGYFYLARQRTASWILMFCDEHEKNWVVGPLTKRGAALRYIKKSAAVDAIIVLCTRGFSPGDLINPSQLGISAFFEPLSAAFEKQGETLSANNAFSQHAHLYLESVVKEMAVLKNRLSTLENRFSGLQNK